jgi:large subunit ribosomal protein L25
MERIKIKVKPREKVGKEWAKKDRKVGEVPAIVYGKNTNLAVAIPTVSLKILKSTHFSKSSIVDMDIASKTKEENISVLIKDVQYHPLSEEVIHIDFMKVSLKDKIRVSVPVILKGEAKGTKEGGIVEQILWSLEVEGLPLDIPEKIEVEIQDLDIGDSIHVGDIKVADNLKIITHAEGTIVTVVEKIEEEEAVAAVAEAAPEGPEVIREKKETEEGQEAAEGKEGKEKKEGKEEKKSEAPEKEKGK